MNQAQVLIRAAGLATTFGHALRRGLLVSALLACSAPVLAQLSTFTGASTNDPVNWCDPTNWDPAGIPANGADIAIGPSHTANMAQCDGSTRILGDVSAAGTIRFYTPVTFAGDATLNNPIFELSTTPAVVGGQILISGNNAWWQGAIFSGGSVINSGLLSVERSFISGRTSPRELTNGGTFTNDGTVRLFQGFKINGGATFSNQGTLTCEATATIGRDNGSGVIQNNGNISVPAGLGITITSGLVSDGEINSTGTLTLQSETTLRGTARVLSGGTIRALAIFNHPVVIGPVNLEGEGNIQLSEGTFQIGEVTSSVRGPAGRGLWIGSTDNLDISQGSIALSEGGLLTWSLGDFQGANGARSTPHININSGARMNVVGAPGLAGGGDALGTFIRVEGEMYQSATARILEASRLVIPTLGKYILSHTRLDGDGTVLLEVRGTFDVNPPEDTSTATTFLNAVNTKLLGSARMNVYRNDLITSSSPIELGGDSRVQIGGFDQFQDARWRAFSEVIVTDGEPEITGPDIFELGSGVFLTIRDALLKLGVGFDPEQDDGFIQLGTVRADPTLGANARVRNDGVWTWRGGAVAFPQGATPPVQNFGLLYLDCNSCQLRADVANHEEIVVLDTLVMAEAGVEVHNASDFILIGHVSDLSTALEGRVTNVGTLIKWGVSGSSFNTTLDNTGEVIVLENTLTINGPIVQFVDGTLTGGTWDIRLAGILRTPNKIVSTVGVGASVHLHGSWPEFQPRTNFGFIDVTDATHTFNQDFDNFGEVQVRPDYELIMGAPRVYSQRATRTGIQGTLRTTQPVGVTGGTLGGSGTVITPSLNNSGGSVAPGSSPGILTVQGNFVQSATGSLDIELAGLTPGTEHDVLAVTAAATLGGTLRVTRLNGYVPTLGDTFTFLTAASVQGAFTIIDAPGFSLTYLANAARLTFTGLPPICDGDVNCDFALDGFDVEVQEKAVGGDMTDYCQPDPDFNGDFALDGFDVEAVELVVGGGPCP